MKYSLFILTQLLVFVCSAGDKPYESYDEIVNRLSNYKQKQSAENLSTTVPIEKMHMSFGLSNTTTRIADKNLGGVNQSGFLIGAATPLITQQLFLEGFGKFYQATSQNNAESNLKQFELRLSHKEPLNFAILNFGIGTSARFLSLHYENESVSYRIPSLLLTAGLERRIANRLSVACDFGYHRSLRDSPNGKNTAEFVFRLNYHL